MVCETWQRTVSAKILFEIPMYSFDYDEDTEMTNYEQFNSQYDAECEARDRGMEITPSDLGAKKTLVKVTNAELDFIKCVIEGKIVLI
jgi:hypothetical protein